MGVPILLSDGTMFGTICAIDEEPYQFSQIELEKMKSLAELLAHIIEGSQAFSKLDGMEVSELKRLTLLGSLASGIAHEMGNSLQSVRGLIQIALNESDKLKTYQEILIDELDHMNKVLKEFVMATQPPAPLKESFAIETLVDELKKVFYNELMLKNINLLSNIKEDLPPITADFAQIRQVLTNVLKNSIEAIGTNGLITLRTNISHNNDELIITVCDNGPGIPLTHLDRVGQPFFTTKDEAIGLGLAINRRIMEAHGGSIGIESSEKGTLVKVTLPLEV
jgi:two-component system, sporulation sensor kinase E